MYISVAFYSEFYFKFIEREESFFGVWAYFTKLTNMFNPHILFPFKAFHYVTVNHTFTCSRPLDSNSSLSCLLAPVTVPLDSSATV